MDVLAQHNAKTLSAYVTAQLTKSPLRFGQQREAPKPLALVYAPRRNPFNRWGHYHYRMTENKY